MQEKFIKFIDFIFEEMKTPYGKEGMLTDLSYDFKKKFDIEISYEETEYLENKYFNDLFDRLSNVGLFKLSINALDIIDNFGSYSAYLKANENYNDRQKEIEDLNIELSKLQIENTKLNNRKLKRDLLFGIIGFIIAAIVTNWKDILILMKVLPPE